MIHVIFGPSGSGKTELCKILSSLHIVGEPVSLHKKRTTRAKRGYDEDEIESLTPEAFEKFVKDNNAYTYNREDSDYLFAISKKDIMSAVQRDEEHFIICNDMETIKKIRADFLQTKLRLIYLFYNADERTIEDQIKEKLLEESEKTLTERELNRQVASRFKRIAHLSHIFENNKTSFDGIIFNQYAPGAYRAEVMKDLKKQLYNEIHFSEPNYDVIEKSVFVITPMGRIKREDYGEDYPNDPDFFIKSIEIIKRVCEKNDLRCLNLDEISGQDILQAIHKNIACAQYIIFDLSGNRPNCYYEYGLAKFLNKKTIVICNEFTNTIKFDLSTIHRKTYTLETLENILTSEIQSKLTVL